MRLIRPVPRRIARPLSVAVLLAWMVSMGVLVHRSYLQASAANLATDLARYGSEAQWRGVYWAPTNSSGCPRTVSQKRRRL